MRKLNYEGDYNLIFEKQRKYEEALKSYHEDSNSENHNLEDTKDEKKEDGITPE